MEESNHSCLFMFPQFGSFGRVAATSGKYCLILLWLKKQRKKQMWRQQKNNIGKRTMTFIKRSHVREDCQYLLQTKEAKEELWFWGLKSLIKLIPDHVVLIRTRAESKHKMPTILGNNINRLYRRGKPNSLAAEIKR